MPVNAHTPGSELATVLAEVAGPEWRCLEATDDELDSILGRFAAIEAWAAFGDARMDQYRATAYCDLLNGVPACERVASGCLAGDAASGGGDEGQTPPDDNGDDPDGGPGWPPPDNGDDPGGSRCAKGPDDSGPGHDQGDVPAHGDNPSDDVSDDDGGTGYQPRLTDLVIRSPTLTAGR